MSKLAWLDVETGGLDFRSASIISVGIVTETEEFYSQVKPIMPVSDKAAGFNKYAEADWDKAPTFDIIANRVTELLTDSNLVAHNIDFDWEFLKAEYRSYAIESPKVAKTICTYIMAKDKLDIRSRSLENIAKHFGIQREGPMHHALIDARMCRLVYERLVQL